VKIKPFCLLKYFLIYSFGLILFFAFDALMTHIGYPVLNNFFPNLVVKYNPVLQKEDYLATMRAMSFIAAVLTVFSLNCIDVIYDNSRLEELVGKTDGFYRLPQGLKIYTGAFLGTDILSAALAPAIYIPLTLIALPEKLVRLMEIIDVPLIMTNAVVDVLGRFFGFFVIFAVSLLGRALGVYLGLKRWRGLWLSDIGGDV